MNTKSLRAVLALLALVLVLAACQRIMVRPVDNQLKEYSFEATREGTFEAMIVAAQLMSLQIDVMDRSSGFIQFKNVSISATDLGNNCKYPIVLLKNQKASVSTFSDWNARSMQRGFGPVYGSLVLSISSSEKNGITTIGVRSKWTAGNRTEAYECESYGYFEDNFAKAVRTKLGLGEDGKKLPSPLPDK